MLGTSKKKDEKEIGVSDFILNKINAVILLLLSLLVGLGQSGNIAAAVMSGNIKFPKLIIACVIFILCIVGVVKSVIALKRGSNVTVVAPTSFGKKIVYQLGNMFLILSGIAAIYTLGLMVYLFITNAAGVPAGMGLAAVIILFVVGQALKSLVQETHDRVPSKSAESLRD